MGKGAQGYLVKLNTIWNIELNWIKHKLLYIMISQGK